MRKQYLIYCRHKDRQISTVFFNDGMHANFYQLSKFAIGKFGGSNPVVDVFGYKEVRMSGEYDKYNHGQIFPEFLL